VGAVTAINFLSAAITNHKQQGKKKPVTTFRKVKIE